MEEAARQVADRLREPGHIAYFAGGCVRDIVRGIPPKDFDIATDARPEEVQESFPPNVAVGAQFGVIIVLENGFQFEVATFRSDEAYIEGGILSQCIFVTGRRRKATRLHDKRDVLRSGIGTGHRFRRWPGRYRRETGARDR